MSSHFTLPLYIDLTATCLYAMTDALLAIRRHYDVIVFRMLAIALDWKTVSVLLTSSEQS